MTLVGIGDVMTLKTLPALCITVLLDYLPYILRSMDKLVSETHFIVLIRSVRKLPTLLVARCFLKKFIITQYISHYWNASSGTKKNTNSDE